MDERDLPFCTYGVGWEMSCHAPSVYRVVIDAVESCPGYNFAGRWITCQEMVDEMPDVEGEDVGLNFGCEEHVAVGRVMGWICETCCFAEPQVDVPDDHPLMHQQVTGGIRVLRVTAL
jgi:hypothetical protein